MKSFLNGNFARIPWMTGMTRDEADELADCKNFL